MRTIIFIAALFISNTIFGQFINNNKWITGVSVGDVQQIRLDFSSNTPVITQNTTNIGFNCHGMCPTIVDSLGNILFYTNGRLIINREGDLMENGDDFQPALGQWPNFPPLFGHLFFNNSFIIPDFTEPNMYFYFYLDYLKTYGPSSSSTFDLYKTSLYYLRIDMSKNGGLGKVVEKNIPALLRDSLVGFANFTPVRHANGRDWWIFSNELGINRYHRLLLTPDGIVKDFPVYTIAGPSPFEPDPHPDDVFGFEISKDGTKYVVGGEYTNWVYDFDRCTGMLSNPVKLFEDTIQHYFYEMAISANNRYLYVADIVHYPHPNASYLWRYDLWSSDPASSRSLVLDGKTNTFADYFELIHLPNGQLGFSESNSRIMHTIVYPEEEEIVFDTNYLVHDFEVNYFRNYMHNTVNYYLGPIDNESCDTLGIDNHPLAHWRYDRRPDPFEIKFVDLTYYEPTYWQWDFGDGEESTEQHPIHVYGQTGVYEVCLIVGNEYSADTLCKEVVIGDQLTVDIAASAVVGCAPSEVTYHAETVEATGGVHWSFEGGDPAESNSPDVVVTYTEAGTYTTELTATGLFGDKTVSHSVTIEAAPIADYNFTITELTIETENVSEHATSYVWDFGDGATATTANPTHTFIGSGLYGIQLIATNSCGLDTIIRHLLITDTEEPSLSIGYTISPNPSSGLFNIQFTKPLAAGLDIMIYNILGQVILRKHLKAGQLEMTIDLTAQASGSYLYRLTYDGKRAFGKLVVE